jgi:S-DNA-T family DNA segregation ATPase FtsK/SpoIIIE
MILKKIQEFQISGRITGIQKSLSVTTYEFTPSPGVKQARVLALGDDLALGLGQASLMIQPIPERQALGIQLLEPNPKTLKLGSLLGSKVYQDMPPLSLPLPLGLSLYGEPLIQDLRQMPHLLISGTTGSGKSIALHSMIASLIYRLDPTQLKLILIDPKMLEFKSYQGIGHLLFPVAKDPHKALELLQWTVDEMENRYKLMEQDGARDLAFYEGRVPLILVVIDEWADLMGQLPKEMESLVQRLCQKARASGIHLILATQRPSVDVITGVIKANMPARMAFQLPSKYDSRTVLDQGGAEKLRGKGDFLFMAPGFGKTVRGQAPYLSEEEIQGLTLALRAAKV